MLESSLLLEGLQSFGATSFYGVPDSTLDYFCSYANGTLPKERHTICVNEGVAIGCAIGYHLATGNVPVVYMQNSGLGNSVNPVTSLAAKEIYSIPILLLVGWRGEPDIKDEPQHVFLGRITTQLLDTLEIPYSIIDADTDMVAVLNQVRQFFVENNSPYALLVRKGTFAATPYSTRARVDNYTATREEAIRTIVDSCPADSVFVSTTGMASRELFEIRELNRQGHGSDFLTVGGMGCASSIALEVARGHADKQVVCIDGDGAALMHMGAMATIGSIAPKNLLHVVINNGEHGSTGGQPTISRRVDMCGIARACGYEKVFRLTDLTELPGFLQSSAGKLTFVEIMTCNSYRKDLGRPTTTPVENKADFMERLG